MNMEKSQLWYLGALTRIVEKINIDEGTGITQQFAEITSQSPNRCLWFWLGRISGQTSHPLYARIADLMKHIGPNVPSMIPFAHASEFWSGYYQTDIIYDSKKEQINIDK